MLDSRASSSHDALRGGPPLPCILVRQAAVALIVIRDRFLESRWLSNSYRVQWFIFNRIHAPYLTWNSYRKLRWNRSVADYTLTSVFSGRARFYIWMIKWMVYLGGSFSRNSGGPFAHCRCSAAEEHVDCIGGYESRWSSLVGRSDPRLFVREIVKRSCDLCKRMQVAAAHDGPAVTESENCCPGGGSRLASFFPLALWCLCPSVSFWTGPCFLPSFSLSLSFSFLYLSHPFLRFAGFIRALVLAARPLSASYEVSRKRWNGRAPVMFMNERSCDCALSNWLLKVLERLGLLPLPALSLFSLVENSDQPVWISLGERDICLCWMKYLDDFRGGLIEGSLKHLFQYRSGYVRSDIIFAPRSVSSIRSSKRVNWKTDFDDVSSATNGSLLSSARGIGEKLLVVKDSAPVYTINSARKQYR